MTIYPYIFSTECFKQIQVRDQSTFAYYIASSAN